jgi:hypothetical protein
LWEKTRRAHEPGDLDFQKKKLTVWLTKVYAKGVKKKELFFI